MGFELQWRLEPWQVEKFLMNRMIIISKDRESAIRFLHDHHCALPEPPSLYALKEWLELTELPEHGVVWMQSEFLLEEFGADIPQWGMMPKSFWTYPKHIVLIDLERHVRDLRDVTNRKWRHCVGDTSGQVPETVEFETPVWTDGGRVHNWRNHVPEHVQLLWSTFNIDQKFAIYMMANATANAEEWE